MTKKQHPITTTTIIITIIILIGYTTYKNLTKQTNSFDGSRALQNAAYQVSLGPRTMGSNAHAQVVTWIDAQLKKMGWTTDIQTSTWNSQPIQNIIARRGQGHPWIILGAHYDCRFIADKDPDPNKRSLPVLGANDSASGVAVLLELARVLPYKNKPQVWMVFFDAEDNYNIPGWEGNLGSSAFVHKLNDKPDEVIIIDMIGDSDLNIYYELNSDQKISIEIWKQAAELGYKQFIPIEKYRIIDDHVPFLEMSIPAVDIIDFDYPYWHTTMDTLDKISSASLQAVGDTLQKWILGK